MNPYEKKSYSDKLARLHEQSEDMAANVVRKDPFEVLPLELVIHIMQIGLEESSDMVLNCTFVSRAWRMTLIYRCPELWGKISFRWRHLREKKFEGKRDEWLMRCDQRPHTVEVLEEMTLSGVGKIPKELRAQFFFVKNLRLDMKDNKVVRRFCDKFAFHFHSLEHLWMHSGGIDEIKEEAESFYDLHCDLLNQNGYGPIKTMEIANVDFRDRYLDEFGGIRPLYGKVSGYKAALRASYPKLESLVLTRCKFDTAVNRGEIVAYEGHEQRRPWDSYDISASPDDPEPDTIDGRYNNCPLQRHAAQGPEPARTRDHLPSCDG